MPSPPLSLYVHLPWCVSKCPYCDFNSHTAGAAPPRERYLAALCADLEHEAKRAVGRELVSVFLGGGTPSLFPPAEIRRLLDTVSQRFSLAPDVEITMEANPGTVECGDPAGYRLAGVNRLSIGAQSFDPRQLRTLGRIHSADDVRRACKRAQDAGFDNLNVDLMYGLPGQTTADAVADIEAALALAPQHLSWYQLTLEPNTVFHARPPPGMPDDDLCFDMQRAGQALLADRGFERYEVSAYAAVGRRCRHNLNYWAFGDYLAVGAGAHGKLSTPEGVRRYAKPANPLGYMRAIESGAPEPAAPPLGARELLFEFMLNALRLTEGFSEDLFERRTGLGPEALVDASHGARARGLIRADRAGLWRPTELGMRFLDDLQAEFLP